MSIPSQLKFDNDLPRNTKVSAKLVKSWLPQSMPGMVIPPSSGGFNCNRDVLSCPSLTKRSLDLLPLLLLHLDWVPQPQRATRGIFRAEPNTAAVSVVLCQLATWRGKVLKHWPNSRGDEFPEAGVQKY